jgi:hypothetical protein
MTVEELIIELETIKRLYGEGLQVLTTGNFIDDIDAWPLKGILLAEKSKPILTDYGLAYPMNKDNEKSEITAPDFIVVLCPEE